MDWPGHLPPHIFIELYSNINLCPVFYFKAHLYHTESFKKKLDGCCVTSRQYIPVCAKTVSFWAKEGLSMAKTHMSLSTLQGAMASAALVG